MASNIKIVGNIINSNTVSRYSDNDTRLINLDINTQALITMPVSALSDSFNIYRTLEMYNSQKCSSLFKGIENLI